MIGGKRPSWIGGVAPLETHDVIVQGPMVVRTGDVCRNLTVTSAGSIVDLVGGNFGRRVSILADDYHEAGNHRVIWTPKQMASGFHFVRLLQGKNRTTIPIVLVD